MFFSEHLTLFGVLGSLLVALGEATAQTKLGTRPTSSCTRMVYLTLNLAGSFANQEPQAHLPAKAIAALAPDVAPVTTGRKRMPTGSSNFMLGTSPLSYKPGNHLVEV
jgi:hypothetical protein